MKVLMIWDVMNVAYYLTKGLLERNVQTHLLVPRRVKAREFYMSHLFPSDNITLTNAGSTLALLKELRRQEYNDFDLFHAHYALSPAICCALLGKRFLVHCYGSDVREAAKKLKYRYFIKFGLRKAKKVLVSTPDLIRHVEDLGVEPEFLPCPIDLDVFRPCESEIDLRLGFDFVLFHPSRIEWQSKGTDKVVRAFSRIVDHGQRGRLVMVDYGPDLERTKKLINELKIGKNVLFVPPIPHQEMPNYLNSCDIVLDQFNIGHFGLVSIEGMSCGKPVVVDYRFIEHYGAAPVVRASTIDEISLKIEELLNDEALRDRLSEVGRRYVVEHHALPKIVDDLLNIYEEILRC